MSRLTGRHVYSAPYSAGLLVSHGLDGTGMCALGVYSTGTGAITGDAEGKDRAVMFIKDRTVRFIE